METIINMRIDHPIFGDYCQVKIKVNGIINPYIPATYWQPAEGGDIEDLDIEVLSIDEKVYRKQVMKAIEVYLYKHYEYQIMELFAQDYEISKREHYYEISR